MRILCKIAGHRAVPSNVWNDGYFFSRCSNCDCEMIGRFGEWQPVPRGFKVVWRSRQGATNWTPYHPPMTEGGRLSDMLGCTECASFDEDFTPIEFNPSGASIVEGLHARSARG